MLAIFKREFCSYFTSPLGYIVIAIYVFLSSLFTSVFYLDTGYSYAIADAIAPMMYFALFIIPPITMRSFTEEKRQHTDRLILTSPVSLTGVVAGKFLSAFALYFICCLSYILYAFATVIIVQDAAVEWGLLLTGFLGTVFLGFAMIAVNIFISTLTESQMTAMVLGMGVGLFVYIYDVLLYSLQSALSSILNKEYTLKILDKISITDHYINFVSGVVSLADLVFFLSIGVLFMFLSGRVLDRKRWA